MLFTLPHIIQNSARSFTEQEAFRCGKDSMSYGELDKKTDQLASHLITKGVRKGDRIGVYMERCLETALAVYGIMKAGAVYVPLDPSAPHARTRFLLADCGIKHVTTTAKQRRKIKAILETETNLESLIGIDADLTIPSVSWDAIFKIDLSTYQPVKIIESDLSYIMYTSGSTGAPKGIMHTHHSGLSYAKLSAQVYNITLTDRIANHAPLHFDISTFGYFSGPLAGATTVIIPDAHTKLPASLSALMEHEKITIWYSVPLALVQLLLNGVLDERDLSPLRWVLYGGENFVPKYMRELMGLWPSATFSNVYGPAEVNQCTYYHLNTPPETDEQIPIGKIWENTTYKILGEDNSPVPKGTSGELLVRSATMMKGYWNNNVLTKKALYTEHIAPGVEHVFYRTGDLVKEDEQGNLIFLGRNDRQVKLRGYRVELDEVEAVLGKHDSVEEAAVFILENENNEKQIAAAIIGTKEIEQSADHLIAFSKTYLPPYAIPNHIYFLQDFPRTSSGKVKRSEIVKSLIQR
ncbi:MAG: hypothetical protein Mars2KO_09790 [Maribacter sp.]